MSETAHRPWPLPRGPWALAMSWHELCFLHWPVSADRLRALLPPGLTLDTFEGEAWLGVVPFRMSGVRPRFLPALPGCGAFPELNVRTYVSAGGKPGVWFFSLDASSRLAVRGARLTFGLPYFDARMSLERRGKDIRYRSQRTHRGAEPAELALRYAPCEEVRPNRDSLEAWLTERYCLYTTGRSGSILRGEIHHGPWPLARAECEIERDTMSRWLGLERGGSEPLAHYAERLDVVAWLPRLAETP